MSISDPVQPLGSGSGLEEVAPNSWRIRQLERSPTEIIPISSLRPSDSPRLSGENKEHVKVLAESEAPLPPIIVHRSTMRVIDGMHRLSAAVLRGWDEIEVRFFEGGEQDAFVFAVEANVTHGLPLSLNDRTAAATRIIGIRPQWSDRMIATLSGLSAKTVAAIRRRSSEESPQSNARVSRDGRVRPLNASAGRQLASELMRGNPEASVREIARAAGVSPSTVWDVRERLRQGEDPVPARHRGLTQPKKQPRAEVATPPRREAPDRGQIMDILQKDPSIRSEEKGRQLLRWLNFHTVDLSQVDQLVNDFPEHCSGIIAKLARVNAETWNELANRLEKE